MAARRRGISLIEMMATMVVIVIVGGLAVPTVQSLTADTGVKRAGDALRAQVSAARACAIRDGQAYRLSVSDDGSRVRVTIDDPAAETDETPLHAEEDLPETVHATPVETADGQTAGDDGGWVRVATFLPDGTCREDSAEVDLTEPGCYTLRLTIRGLTGAATLSKVTNK